MKIRTGFVSNSSSSSFVIIGKEYTQSKFEELLFEHLTEDQQVEYEDDPYAFVEDLEDILPGVDVIYDSEAGYVYVGEVPVASKKARQRVAKSLGKFDPEITATDVNLINEEIYG